jgi:hypothetical protein
MEHILNSQKLLNDKDLQEIKVENISMCDSCLFEIKDGKFLCTTCKQNLCEIHITKHIKHNIFKLVK